MGTYDGAGTRISDDTPIRFLYNGQFGVETDENGLYYMRARYYNTDIKRFMNRDIINGSIENSQSLNKYCYVQGNPVTLTDPFGLCPEGGGTNEELQLSKHTLLDIAGCIPVIGWMFDLANAVSYIQEKNYTAALISALSAFPGIGNLAGSALKLGSKVVKSVKIAQTAEKAADICRTIGAAGNVAANTVALGAATNVAIKEYKSTGKVSAGTMLNVAASAAGVAVSAKALSSATGPKVAKTSKTKLNYVSSNGSTFKATSGKTTTILGTYSSDTGAILEELGNVKSLDFGPRNGGFNLLNTPDELYISPNQFWNEYNKPWLDNVIARDDIIQIATEPTWSNLTRVNKTTGKLELSGFGREYTYLKKHGYKYDPIKKTMSK